MTSKGDFNPFEDASIKNLTDQSNTSSVENYNPFDSKNLAEPIVDKPSPSQSPDQTTITMSQAGDVPPPYSPSGAQQQLSEELKRRQEELENKANELQAREAQLSNVPMTGTNKNWPPLPAKCCVGPCFYQDISVEIPDSYQKTVRFMYYMWIFYTILLLLNMLGSLALFFADKSQGTTFGYSILVFFLFIPLSFLCWFRPLYKAFRADSSFNFMIFFLVFFFQFMISVFYAVGIPGMGSCGLLVGITTFSEKSNVISTYTVGIIAIVIGLFWAAHAMISFYMLVKIHRIYRGTTASFAKAKEELASGVLKNQHVQNAAANAASQAARQSFNSAASGLRY